MHNMSFQYVLGFMFGEGGGDMCETVLNGFSQNLTRLSVREEEGYRLVDFDHRQKRLSSVHALGCGSEAEVLSTAVLVWQH